MGHFHVGVFKHETGRACPGGAFRIKNCRLCDEPVFSERLKPVVDAGTARPHHAGCADNDSIAIIGSRIGAVEAQPFLFGFSAPVGVHARVHRSDQQAIA